MLGSRFIDAVCIAALACAILLTGGIAHDIRFTALIKKRVDMLAPVLTFAGENEMRALAEGALRVIRGEERVSRY